MRLGKAGRSLRWNCLHQSAVSLYRSGTVVSTEYWFAIACKKDDKGWPYTKKSPMMRCKYRKTFSENWSLWELGHGKIDIVFGCFDNSEVLLTLGGRMMWMRNIIEITTRTTEAVAEGLQRIRAQYSAQWSTVFRIITIHNGDEFAGTAKSVFRNQNLLCTRGNAVRIKNRTCVSHW